MPQAQTVELPKRLPLVIEPENRGSSMLIWRLGSRKRGLSLGSTSGRDWTSTADRRQLTRLAAGSSTGGGISIRSLQIRCIKTVLQSLVQWIRPTAFIALIPV